MAENCPSLAPLAPAGSAEDEDGLRRAIELLYFAYRDFTGEADAVLARHGFGRAHHRVIYFVGRKPGMTVGDLLSLLKITKQSLARVLRELSRSGFIEQRRDSKDGRLRRLFLTSEAMALENLLTKNQASLIASAYRSAGPEAPQHFCAVLKGLIQAQDRHRFD